MGGLTTLIEQLCKYSNNAVKCTSDNNNPCSEFDSCIRRFCMYILCSNLISFTCELNVDGTMQNAKLLSIYSPATQYLTLLL